jgi:hypothetical protein
MPSHSSETVPFALSDGWPQPIPGCVETIRETGIVLGSLLLEDDEWRALRSSPLLSLRIDDHPETGGWTTRQPDGTESHTDFEVPLAPVVVPPTALTDSRAFSEWVMETHGASGRLLIWDESQRWWMVHEPDLELVVICAPPGMFSDESDELSWLSIGSAEGQHAVKNLMARYGMTRQE